MLDEPLAGRILDAHRRHARARVGGIGGEPGPLDDVVLEQAMDEDDVRAEQLLAAGDALADDRAVVDDDLEVEVRDPDAGVALALRGGGDVPQAAPEREVGPLDRLLQRRALDRRRDDVGEGGVALELGQAQHRPQAADDRRDEVGEDVLGVVELDAGEVAGVAADVGDDEAGRFRLADQGRGSTCGCVHDGRAGRRGQVQRAVCAGGARLDQRDVPCEHSGMASRKEILEIGGREVAVSNPDKVYFPVPGLHEARPRPLLPRRRRRGAGRGPRPADGAQALRRRHRQGAVLPEAGARQPARVDARRDAHVPVGPDGGRDRRRRGGGPRLGRQPRLHRPQPAPRPRRGHGPPRRAARRPRPGAGRALVAGARGRAASCTSRSTRWASSAGRRRPARAGSTSTCGSSRAGPTRRSGGRRWRWRATSSGARRRSRPRSGGRRSATACSSTTTRTRRTGPWRPRTPSGRSPDARVSFPLRWDEVADVVAEDFTLATVPGAVRASGATPAPGSTTRSGSLDALLELSARDEAEGQGDAPWPPNYAKQEGEPPRVQPSKKRKPDEAYEGRGKDGGPPPEVAAERAAAVAAGDRERRPADRVGGHAARRRPAAASRASRSSRSRGPRPRPRSTRASSAGRRATPRWSSTSSPPTSSPTGCAAAPTSGTGCGST